MFEFLIRHIYQNMLTIVYRSEKSTQEELLHGNIRNSRRMISVALAQVIRHQFVLTDYCQIQFIWLELQYTQITLCGALEKHLPP